jgi:hypothetical protein
MSCFSFSLFSPIKSENRKPEQVLPREEGWHKWQGQVLGKGVGGEHSAIECVHVNKCRNDTSRNYSRNWRRGR